MPLLITFRALALAIVIFLIDYFLPLGTSPFILSFACAVGVIFGGICANSRLKILGFISSLLVLTLCLSLTSKLTELFALPYFSDPLELHSIQLHAILVYIAFLLGALSTWTVVRSVHGLSAEVLIIVFSTLYFFAGHRNFNFQSPQILGSLSWSLGYSPLAVLTSLGLALIAVTLIYLRICSGLHEARLNISRHFGRSSAQARLKSLLSTLCILGLFVLIGNSIFSRFKVEAEARTANGVGQGKEENQSPLGFNSALGASNQPAALLRLDGDYSDNPFVPMLYLRESALSLYNGVEMVAADASYDQDAITVPPGSHFKTTNDPEWEYRTPVLQSIFLLSDHKLSFAIDYPLSINPLKNPNPSRFKSAYKAYSMAPAFPKSIIKTLTVGDPRWDQQTRSHYLKTSQDPRYAELAKKVSADIDSPIEKALALTSYLTQKAIYTLSPGHDLPENGDQTAPFLFGDMRGYCVHFAHALVYLFRSLDIPARVSTGYLTDLSEARDGHILLRMSDRHAWAEVFITDLGWVPFDPKPEQVESHAESPVDMKLLEELMGLVGPDEEILPTDLTQGEAGLVEPSQWKIPSQKILLLPIFALVALMLVKLSLWYSWILPSSTDSKLKRLYRAIAARINDHGISRLEGETRVEYRKRASQSLGLDLLALTPPLNEVFYSNSPSAVAAFELYNQDIKQLSRLPLSKRLKALASPASILRYFARSGW